MQRILGLFVFALAATVFFAGAPAAAGICTSALIEENFALPDGSVHPAGRLTLCPGGFSPVFSLQRTFVDGKPVGMFASRRDLVEQDEDEGHYLIFYRRAGRPLQLTSYGQPSGERTEMFMLDQPARVEVEDSIAFGRLSRKETAGSRPSAARPDRSRR